MDNAPICVHCGHAKDDHPYRHPFSPFGADESVLDPAAPAKRTSPLDDSLLPIVLKLVTILKKNNVISDEDLQLILGGKIVPIQQP